MTGRRLAPCLFALVLLLPGSTRATTATSLAGRVVIDGDVSEYTPDEWVLDASSPFPERSGDSRWGGDNDLIRVAVTWDARFLYLAVDFRGSEAEAMLFVASGAGGLTSLDGAGVLRRAIDLAGLAPTLIAAAVAGDEPSVARAGAGHPFAFVDRATVPAAVSGGSDGRAAFEVAVPWEMLSLDLPVRLLAAMTRGIGSGSGDAAPDPTAGLDSDPFALARLDRQLSIDADANRDGVPDAGVSPRAIARVVPGAAATTADGEIEVTVDPRAFAPDRDERARFEIRVAGGDADRADGTMDVFAADGRAVRRTTVAAMGSAGSVAVEWDGRDDGGHAVPGGIYVVRFELTVQSGTERVRAKRNVGVAVVR